MQSPLAYELGAALEDEGGKKRKKEKKTHSLNVSRARTRRREEEERHQNVAFCYGFQLDFERNRLGRNFPITANPPTPLMVYN